MIIFFFLYSNYSVFDLYQHIVVKIRKPELLRENNDTAHQKTNINYRSNHVYDNEEHLRTAGTRLDYWMKTDLLFYDFFEVGRCQAA